MRRKSLVIVLCGIAVLCAIAENPSPASAAPDWRYTLITRADFAANLAKPGTDLEQKFEYIDQAYHSGLAQYEVLVLAQKVSDNPKSASWWALLANAECGEFMTTPSDGAERSALRCARKALRLNEKGDLVDAYAGYVLYFIGRITDTPDQHRGRELLSKAVAKCPASESARCLYGIALYDPSPDAKSLWPEALTQLKEAIALDPDDANAHTVLGDVYLSMGDMRKCEDEEKIATALRGGAPIGARTLASGAGPTAATAPSM